MTSGQQQIVRPPADAALKGLLRCYLGTAHEPPPPEKKLGADDLFRLILKNGLLMHTLKVLDGRQNLPPPYPELRAALQAPYRSHVAAAVKVHEDGRRALTALSDANIPCIPFKGTFLSQDLYGDPCFRRPGDVDLIIREADLDACIDALAGLGYGTTSASVLIEEYFRTENNAMHLVCAGKAMVDLHYAPHDDLPPHAHDEVFLRAKSTNTETPARLRPDLLDLLMLLAVNYWATDRWEHLHSLIDAAVLLKDFPAFNRAWEDRVRSWGLALHTASLFEAARHEFAIESLAEPTKTIEEGISRKELTICRRIREHGAGGLPQGLVPKMRRLSLPLSRRLALIRKFIWPHPGFVAHQTGRTSGRPGLLDRAAFAFRRLLRVMRTR